MQDIRWHERHYGTAMIEPSVEHHRVNDLSFDRQAGALRTLCYQGVECLRGIRPVIRDDQWGTHALVTRTEHVTSHSTGLQLVHEFDAAERAFEGRFETRMDAHGAEVFLTLKATRTLETCRSGLIVLLPLKGVVGCPVQITHSNDTVTTSRFPELISPGQPFFDILGLGYTPLHGPAVQLSFEGDIFEMEDQRNWSDASFKIYSRPLAWPSPHVIEAGETVVQRLSVKLEARSP
ncbi:hypothetical protein [Kushneria indalinina]|uniref:hypothetical protein n=1 Tax=Kushneria indalinina TaxID=184067 RepID=UPI0011C06DAE|nr:hypothetical protein [Kushneria indalinina]